MFGARRFNEEIQQCQGALLTFAYYLMGSRPAAEDVVQDVLVTWWKNRRRIDGNPLPWLMRVTRNACYDRLRSRERTGVTEIEPSELPGDGDPERDAADGAFRRRLTAALREMKEPQRSVVILREMQGMSYAEIGKALDLSLDQVRVYLYRGRRWLRTELKEHYGDVANA